MKRGLLFAATSVVTITIALLLLPGDEWTAALVLCLGAIVFAEFGILFAPYLVSQPSRGLLPWNAGMSVAPWAYFVVAGFLFVLARGGLQWRILLSAHLAALLLFGTGVVAIRAAGERVARTQQADESAYSARIGLRTRVAACLDRLAALSLKEANSVESETREFLDRLRYSIPAAGTAVTTGHPVILKAVERIESALDAMERGVEREGCLLEIHHQIQLADAAIRRHGSISNAE